MPAQTGRDLRIKKGDGSDPQQYTAIAGAREDSFTCERGEIDVTDKDDATTRILLAGGILSATMSVSGVCKDRALLEDMIDGSHIMFQIEWVDSADVLEMLAEISSYENTGSYENGTVEFTCELRSAGAISFTSGA